MTIRKFLSIIVLFFLLLISIIVILYFKDRPSHSFTVLSQKDYQATIRTTMNTTKILLSKLPSKNSQGYLTKVITLAEKQFSNVPYKVLDVTGEGDWCPGNYKLHGCPHIKQSPLFRTDQFVCTTYVQQILALIQAHTLSQYIENFLSISYGAADEPSSSIHYYNRNNFMSSDFNKVNRKHGLLSDALSTGYLKPYAKTVSTVIDHAAWFANQQLSDKQVLGVRVLEPSNGLKMRHRFSGNYPNQYHMFKPQPVKVDYLPKTVLLKSKIYHGKQIYYTNEQILRHIPTPSVLEIVRNDRVWKVGDHSIKDLLHSGIAVSHLGLIYRHTFPYKHVIYHKISCSYNSSHTGKICKTTTEYCKKQKGCHILMFTHATDAYPNGYWYYRDKQGSYQCSKILPHRYMGIPTTCNRVVSMPLDEYWKMYQYGKYVYMSKPSILGFHLEKIHNIALWRHFK